MIDRKDKIDSKATLRANYAQKPSSTFSIKKWKFQWGKLSGNVDLVIRQWTGLSHTLLYIGTNFNIESNCVVIISTKSNYLLKIYLLPENYPTKRSARARQNEQQPSS